MSSLAEIQKSWPTFKDYAPFEPHMPEHSNGFVHVVDRNGNAIATCYADHSAGLASLIAAALNFVLAPASPTEEPKNETPEDVVPV